MPNLRTPLYDWHVGRGARMVPFGGWDMPVQYAGIVAEHKAVRTAAGLFDISHMGRLTFTGPDAGAFLHHLTTNDVLGMAPGQVRYGLVCNEQGGILDDVLVYRFDAFWLMVVNASNRPAILDWIGQQRGAFDVRMQDRTSDWAMVAVQGPQALDLAAKVYPDVRKLKYYTAALYPPALETMPGEEPWIVSRTGYTGEDGVEIILNAESAAPALTLAMRAATEAGINLQPCGLGCRDTLRLEAAMPLYGHELSDALDPLQAGLGWAVKLTKPDFIGKTAIESRANYANRPVRVGLVLEGSRSAREGCPVLLDGAQVGTVTSGAPSPTVGQPVAMAYLQPVAASPGTALAIDIRGTLAPARVVPLPFYKRSKS